ncbi:hypothetical protein OsJ_11440 [Oryza sativa Japonica Group]|uniref:Uncharacterized protein n=1 Tax=Oryza sativa subsp. japonica TaxID=39947 RepID=B9F9A4_ORYSJ|nr:hypothetical protein OsJ_11440 [Oryza sativa Japonica Group]
MARKNEFPAASGKSTSGYCRSTGHTSTISSSGDYDQQASDVAMDDAEQIASTLLNSRSKKWKTIEKQHPGTMANVWKKLKDAFPELRNEDEDCAMKQKRSNQNAANRAKQEMGSKVGTKSIAQIAHELLIFSFTCRETKRQVNGLQQCKFGMQVWKATYQKADGTWSVPNGERVLSKLNEVAQSQQENICSAAVPLVEHFALVLGKKANHSRATAQERVDAAEQRAVAMEDQVRKLDETNAQLQVEQQSQRDELNSQRRTVEGQATDVERMVQQKLDEQMAIYFSRFASSNGVSSSRSPSDDH